MFFNRGMGKYILSNHTKEYYVSVMNKEAKLQRTDMESLPRNTAELDKGRHIIMCTVDSHVSIHIKQYCLFSLHMCMKMPRKSLINVSSDESRGS